MLHGKIHGTKEALVASVHDVRGEAFQSFFDIQVLHRIIQILEPQPYLHFISKINQSIALTTITEKILETLN